MQGTLHTLKVECRSSALAPIGSPDSTLDAMAPVLESVLGSLTGLALSFGGAWAIMKWVFERPFAATTSQALGIAAAMMLMAVLIGVLSGRDVFKETAMSALREV